MTAKAPPGRIPASRRGDRPPPEPHTVHIGRQPIHDATGALYGYELLFRAAATADRATQDGDAATTATMIAAFSEFGLTDLLGGRPGFVNVTRAFLVGDLPVPFDPGVAVLEILETIEIDDEVVAGARRLREAGYELALDDFVWSAAAEPLIDIVDIVKIDVLHSSWDEVIGTVQRCRRPGVRLLAECVEDERMLQRCLDAGFELFQGYFLGRPQTLTAGALAPDTTLALRLLARLSDPEVGVTEVEAILRPDPGLTFRLLKLANSSSSGVTRPVSSIADAVMMVGLQRLRGWMVLMSLAGARDSSDGVAVALTRAHTCELLARAMTGLRPDVAFTLGLLHGIADTLGTSVPDLLDALPPLSADLDAALRGQPGPLRDLLDGVLAYEHRNDAALAASSLPSELVASSYLSALAWTSRTVGAVTASA